MITIQHEAAEKLATDIRLTHVAIDDALANIAALTNSMIDVCRVSDVPPAASQAAIEHVTLGLSNMVQARKGFVSAHRKIAQVQGVSNLQEINFGCTGPGLVSKPNGKRAARMDSLSLCIVSN